MDIKKNRKIMVVLILVAIISFVVGVSVTVASPVTNTVPVWDGDDTWNASGDADSGIFIIKDSNTVCFVPSCDANVVWDGNNLTLNG